MVDRNLDTLAESLNAHGQQEPIVARLITETDRQRWPDAFSERQILLILNRAWRAALLPAGTRKQSGPRNT